MPVTLDLSSNTGFPPVQENTMGSCLSKPPARAPRPPRQTNSVALRERISLNRATLDRILEERGWYRGRQLSEASMELGQQRTWAQAARTFAEDLSWREAHQRELFYQGEPSYSCQTNHRRQDAAGHHMPVDKNKPLPPLPSVASSSESSLEEELERGYIQRHREETLRTLESGWDWHRWEAPQSRVPSIIGRRIRRQAVMGSAPI